MIKLKGDIDWEITRFGVKEGDIIEYHTKIGQNGSVSFDVDYHGSTQTCVVWPDNYDVVITK